MMTRKKPLHSLKYDTKNFKKNYIVVRRQYVLFNKKSKIYFVLLYEIISNKMTFYFFSLVGRRDVTVIQYILIKLKLILNYLYIYFVCHT